jgi:hypothetical protein
MLAFQHSTCEVYQALHRLPDRELNARLADIGLILPFVTEKDEKCRRLLECIAWEEMRKDDSIAFMYTGFFELIVDVGQGLVIDADAERFIFYLHPLRKMERIVVTADWLAATQVFLDAAEMKGRVHWVRRAPSQRKPSLLNTYYHAFIHSYGYMPYAKYWDGALFPFNGFFVLKKK